MNCTRTFILLLGLLTIATTALAQSPEDQAKEILRLYESGQKDTAYILIEPLKKSARFVPAVLYTRAQLTPDDRALNLYREAIALEPSGSWADDCAYQLVRRYADKGDSIAAYAWMNVLKKNYASSSYLADAQKAIAEVTGWHHEEEEPVAKKEVKEEKKDAKPVVKKVVEKKPATTEDDDAPSDTYRSTNMRGYALQVGLFPTKKLAEQRAGQLKKKKLAAATLPKMVDGKKQYALVVGPYASIDDANAKKTAVTESCDCKAFIVKVE